MISAPFYPKLYIVIFEPCRCRITTVNFVLGIGIAIFGAFDAPPKLFSTNQPTRMGGKYIHDKKNKTTTTTNVQKQTNNQTHTERERERN